MKTLSIRNLPDKTYQRLKEMARQNHRSLQEQARLLLEREVRLARGDALARARQWRRCLHGRRFTNVVEMIREDRER